MGRIVLTALAAGAQLRISPSELRRCAEAGLLERLPSGELYDAQSVDSLTERLAELRTRVGTHVGWETLLSTDATRVVS